jgi:uncharacterized protein (TIRG00374 family)
MKNKLILSLSAGVILSTGALFLAFRNVPFADLWTYLGTIQYAWIIPTTLLVIVAFILRALRWQMILNASAPVSFRMSYHPLTIGFMANCILPGRIGEAARPLILNRKEGVSFTTGLATVAAERIFDAGFLLIFLALALGSIPMDTAAGISYGEYHLNREMLVMLGEKLVWLCLFLVLAVFCIAFGRTRSILTRCIDILPEMLLFFASTSTREWVRRTITERIHRLLNHAAEGLLLFKHPMKFAACSGITLAIWFLTALSYYTMSLGCPGVDLSLWQLSFTMVVICFFIALPSVPGYWGIWEAGGVFALTLFGVSSRTAAGFTLANHAIQLLPVVLMGFSSSLALSINVRQITKGLRS